MVHPPMQGEIRREEYRMVGGIQQSPPTRVGRDKKRRVENGGEGGNTINTIRLIRTGVGVLGEAKYP